MSKKEIPERDKPFYLALVSSLVTVLTICITGYGALLGNENMRDAGLEMLKFTFPLTTMSWTFYFERKGKKA